MPELLFKPYGSTNNLTNRVPAWFERHVSAADLLCRSATCDNVGGNPDAQIWACFHSYSRLIQGLTRMRGESVRRRKEAMRLVLDASTPRVVALTKEVWGNRPLRGEFNQSSPQRVLDEALGLNPYTPLLGGVDWSMQERANGTQRVIFRLNNVRDIARSKMLLVVHRALHAPHPKLFATRGNGGVNALLDCLSEHLPGKERVLKADVPRCFPSLRKASVEQSLLFPERVTVAHLTDPLRGRRGGYAGDQGPDQTGSTRARRMNRTHPRGSAQWFPYEHPDQYISDSRLEVPDGEYGVMPGIPLAALAAEVVLAPLIDALESVAPGVIAILYVDDLLILLPSAKDEPAVLAALAAAVRDAIREQSSVELLRDVRSFDPRVGFSFLGIDICLSGDRVKFMPNPGYWEHAQAQLLAEIDQHSDRFDEHAVRQSIHGRLQRYRDGGASLNEAFKLYKTAIDAVSTSNPIRSMACAPMESGSHIIHTDGSCACAQGAGGWAAIIDPPGQNTANGLENILQRHKNRTTLKGGAALTSCIRMELTAVVEALKTLPARSNAIVRSDSRYVVDNANHNLARWMASKFKRTNGKPVAHQDLWQLLARECARIEVQFQWVKAHAGDPGNELADQLARSEMSRFHRRNIKDVGGVVRPDASQSRNSVGS